MFDSTGNSAESGNRHYLAVCQLDGAGSASPVALESVTALLNQDKQLWVQLDAGKPAARSWLEANSQLEPIVIDGLLASQTRPRIAVQANQLLMLVRGVNLGSSDAAADMISLRIWTDGVRLFSAQLRHLKATETLESQLNTGEGPDSVGQLLVRWLSRLIQDMDDSLAALEEQTATLEERALSESYRALQSEFGQLRRKTLKFRRYLEPQRRALAQLAQAELDWLGDAERMQIREISELQHRHVEAIEHIHSQVSIAHEEQLSDLSAEMNERMYVMSIVAALFLPLGFFTGLMGINVGGMPGVDNEWAFWLVSGFCTLVLAGLYMLFRRKGWW